MANHRGLPPNITKEVRPHSSLGYRPSAPETIVMPSWPPGCATLRRPPSLAEKPPMH